MLIAAGIAYAVFLHDQIEWGRKVRIAVYFHQVTGLREGADFVVAGRAVGSIESIGFSPRGAPGPLLGTEGVKVTIAIDAGAAQRIERGGDVFIASRGALGERYIEIGPSPQPMPPLADGLEILGRDPPNMDRVLQRTWDNLNVARAFADAIGPEVETLRARLRELDETLASLAPEIGGLPALRAEIIALVAEAREVRDVGLGGEAGRVKLEATIAQARATLARGRAVIDLLGGRAAELGAGIDGLRARVGKRGPAAVAAVETAIERLRGAIAKVDPLLAKVDELQRRLARGEGSIGRLMKDPEFPEDAKELGRILKRQPWRIFARPQN